MERAEELTSLDTPGSPNWHLKLAISLFDEKGDPQEQGTLEEWWAAQDKYKIVYRTAEYTSTELHNEKGSFLNPQTKTPSFFVTELLDQVVHPLSRKDDVRNSHPELRTQNFGKVPLECIMLSQPIKSRAPAPFGLFPTYCFDPGKDVLRLFYNFASQIVIRNGAGKFQNHVVAMDTAVNLNGIVRAKGHVEALTGGPAATLNFEDESEVEVRSLPTAKIGAGLMAGTILSKQQPVYPESARRQRIAGSVVMRALIGRDGRIEKLQLTSVPDPDLAIAALAAVRHWTYKPYLLNGEPVEVDTTITVNFNLSP